MKTFDILSFDGGGSKGAMEVVILKDVMNTVTLLKHDPSLIFPYSHIQDGKELFENSDDRMNFAQLLESVSHPIHPTEVFDMIVGTSTGALISFALVGGNVKNDKRIPMTVNEVIEMYRIATPRIFQTDSKLQMFLNWLTNKIAGVPIYPYGQDGIESLLQEYYGNTTLKDFEGPCIAAAVARKFDSSQKENSGSTLEIFDTKSSVSYRVVDVLKATADAPVYFRTPTRIGDHLYIDGGVGGNCPLAQAIPRMRELSKVGHPNSVLSISPPRFIVGDIPSSGQAFFWLQYFPSQVTDGYAVYKDTKKHYESQDVIFQRLNPRSPESELYPMDELNINAMINTMEKEKRADPTYFQEILVAAVVIATRIIDDKFDEFCSFCTFLIEWTLRKNKPETAFYISKAMVKLFQKKESDLNYAISLYYLGFSYFDLENFSKAKEVLLKCNEILKDHTINNKSKDLKIKVIDLLGRCYYDLGIFDKSEDALKEALEMKKMIDSPDSQDCPSSLSMLPTLINLSKTQMELNKFNEALNHANLALSKDVTDINCDQIALVNRGKCYMQLENFSKAIDDFEKIDMNQESKIHQATLNSFLAHCYLSLGRMESALLRQNFALQIYKEIPEEQFDPHVIKIELLAGEVFLASADYYNALHRFEKGQKYAKAMFEPLTEHPMIAECLLHLGILRVDLEEYDIAQRFLEQALAMQHHVYTECKNQHLLMVKTYGELARTFMLQNRFEEAYDNVNKGLEMIQRILPKSLSEARLLYIKGEIDRRNNVDNLKVFEEALGIYTDTLGQESKHPGIPIIFISQATILSKNDELPQALEKITESLFLLKQIYGSIKHPNQAFAYETQGTIFTRQGKFDSAKESFEIALAILSDVFGDKNDHEATKRIKKSKDVL